MTAKVAGRCTPFDRRLVVPSAPELAGVAVTGVGYPVDAYRVARTGASGASGPVSRVACGLASARESRAKRSVKRARWTLGSWVSIASSSDARTSHSLRSSATVTLSVSKHRLRGKVGDHCCGSGTDDGGGGGDAARPAAATLDDPHAPPAKLR